MTPSTFKITSFAFICMLIYIAILKTDKEPKNRIE